ncbi:MAG: BspA family leucine-rich repeat surface protein [Prevotella sp.]|nr:BspA family leucine-rich repeat surface protein [Prevotella sp.]
MKRIYGFLLFLALFTFVFSTKAFSQTGYAILEGNTLTFKYGTKPAISTAWDIPEEDVAPGWMNYATSIKTVAFDATFANARPQNCSLWFKDFEYLTQINNIENLNTSETTNMWGMFWGCKALKSIALIDFETYNVTDMSYMFFNCEKLESLDLTTFNTAKVTDMSNMFGNCMKLSSIVWGTMFQTFRVRDMTCMFQACTNLKRLDLSNFQTLNVENMFGMFRSCISLYSLDLSNFNTSKVTDMSEMFYDCEQIKRIDIHNFNIEKLSSTIRMFSYCRNLEKIICDGDWSGVSESMNMFYNCTNLVGAIPYNSANVTASYANKTTGYFSPFYYYIAEISNDHKTLTFRRSETAPNRTTQWDATRSGYEEIDTSDDDDFQNEYTFHKKGEIVVFDESFKDARPNSCYAWFGSDLEEIVGIENLNTSEVTNMAFMFYGCNKLKTIDVRHFDVSQVTNTAYMFYGCTNLETIIGDDDWNNGQIVESYNMFWCPKLGGAISYDSHKNDIKYANPNTGYFTSYGDEIRIPSNKICTYSSNYSLDFTNVTGLKAYIVSGFSPSTCTLVLTPATTIPAGEGLLLKGEEGTYVIPHTTTDMIYSNLLVGVPTTTYVYPTDGEYTNFILANGIHGINFYTLSEGGNIAGGKAYLKLPTSEIPVNSRALKLCFTDEEITGINTAQNKMNSSSDFYDLQGRKVKSPVKGLYVVNGKKVIIK